MPQAITIDILDRMRPNLASLIQERAKTLAGMRYCDLRISVREEKGAMAENGNEKPALRTIFSTSGCGPSPGPG